LKDGINSFGELLISSEKGCQLIFIVDHADKLVGEDVPPAKVVLSKLPGVSSLGNVLEGR
jgi:hypothetical protein